MGLGGGADCPVYVPTCMRGYLTRYAGVRRYLIDSEFKTILGVHRCVSKPIRLLLLFFAVSTTCSGSSICFYLSTLMHSLILFFYSLEIWSCQLSNLFSFLSAMALDFPLSMCLCGCACTRACRFRSYDHRGKRLRSMLKTFTMRKSISTEGIDTGPPRQRAGRSLLQTPG